MPTVCKSVHVDGVKVFYREAGTRSAGQPTFLLMHGAPSSSAQYHDLIARLAPHYHVIAPDLPGFGFTVAPTAYKYTFENLAKTMSAFIDTLELAKIIVYVFDFGAPTVWRICVDRPDLFVAIISQNGNAFEAGLSDEFWAPVRKMWAGPRDAIDPTDILALDWVSMQYKTGEPDPDAIPPEQYWLDYALTMRPVYREALIDLLYDYRNNLTFYPRLHEYMQAHQPPIFAIWGKGDPAFIPKGTEGFKRIVPSAEIKLIDAGHFALALNVDLVADEVLAFLQRRGL